VNDLALLLAALCLAWVLRLRRQVVTLTRERDDACRNLARVEGLLRLARQEVATQTLVIAGISASKSR